MTSETAPEVLINGVRYVPAREVAGGLEDFRQALLDIFWGEGYRGSNPERAEDGIFITVYDSNEFGGEPFTEFMDNLTDKLAGRALLEGEGK